MGEESSVRVSVGPAWKRWSCVKRMMPRAWKTG